MAGVELRCAPLVGVAYGERRGQGVDLGPVFAVEAHVGRVAFEEADLRLEGHAFVGEEALRGPELRAVVAALAVEVGERHERADVGRVDLQRLAVGRHCQRVVAPRGVDVAQGAAVGRVVRRFAYGAAHLLQRPVVLARGEQQAPLHRPQIGDATEAHVGRVERHHGGIGLPVLLVEGRQQAVVVGVVAVGAHQAAVDPQRLAEATVGEQRLAVDAQVPLVGRVLPPGAAGILRGPLRPPSMRMRASSKSAGA